MVGQVEPPGCTLWRPGVWKNRAMPSAAGQEWSHTPVVGSTGRTLLAAAVGLALAVASLLGPVAVAVVLAVCVVGLALGWPRLLGLPSPAGSSAVVALAGLGALGSALGTGTLVPLIAVLAFAVVAAFVHEMARRDGRPRLVESVTGTVAGAVAAVSAAGWVVVSDTEPPVALVTVAGVVLTLAALAAFLPLPYVPSALLATGVGIGVGMSASEVLAGLGAGTGAAVGFGAGLFAFSVRAFFDHYPSSGRPSASSAVGALPACALGIPCYALSLLFGG